MLWTAVVQAVLVVPVAGDQMAGKEGKRTMVGTCLVRAPAGKLGG